MRVMYDGREVREGSCLHPGDAVPCVEFETRTYCSMVMFDPDAVGGSKIHWLVLNIGRVGDGTTVLSYVPPNPPRGSGLHRYVFWILEHDHRIPPPRLSDRFIGIPTLLSLIGVPMRIVDTFFFVARK